MPQFKEKIEAYKRELNKDGALIVSEETYVEVKSKRDDERSLKEEIQVKVYEALEKYQREVEMLRSECEDTSKELQELRLKAERDSRELQSQKRLQKDREEDSRRKIDDLETRNTKLE